MGNCMETWRQDEGEEQQEMKGDRERAKGSSKDDDDHHDDDGCVRGKNGGMKVRIVLTRHELEMFLLQLSENYDGKLMVSKNVMGDLQKKISSSPSPSPSPSSSPSSSSLAWKPSLESIMEYPEVQEMDR